MNILNFFKKQDEGKGSRRKFMKASAAALLGATVLANSDDLFAMKSKTGLIYVKGNEVVNNYKNIEGGAQPFLGELMCVGFNFAPNGWAQCNGQFLSIGANQALFSLLGTTYGGNGVTTFALPDLRGRTPMHAGQGSGLTNRNLGEIGGQENHTLLLSEIPAHNHNIAVNNSVGSSSSPTNNYFAQNIEGTNEFSTTSNTTMNAAVLQNTGGGQAHNNMQPYLVLNWIIALQGIFPSHP